MNSAVSVSFVLFVTALAGFTDARWTHDLVPKIVNGQRVKTGEIPFQVSLQLNGRHFCGGSVLNANYVLTAAHCVEGQTAAEIEVVAGTINLQSRPTVHQAVQLITHEKYTPSNLWMNDVALIKVKTPFSNQPHVSYVPLPKANEAIPAGSLAVVSGWGRIRQNGPTTNELLKANIYITDQKVCKSAYGTIFNSQICANDPKNDKGACNGDSGGPLTVNGKIVGIVSWSRGCGLADYPTVYTRVTSYLDWIRKHAV